MILVAGIALAVGAILFVAYRRGRLLLASLSVVVLALVATVLAAAAVGADYRDADGFVDCWPNCTAFQDTVGTALFAGPAAFVVGLVGLVVGATLAAERATP